MSLNLCGTIGGNTGMIPCDAQRGLPKLMFVGGKVFVPADYATPDTLQAAIRAAVKEATGSPDKLFPFPEIGGTTDQTDALKTATLGYGLKQVTIEGRPGYSYQVQVGQAGFQALRLFNRAIVPVFTVDDQNNQWGTLDSAGNWAGEVAQIFVSGNGFGDGTKPFVADISIAYQSASDFNDYSKYATLNFNPNEAKGLVTVELTAYTHAANVIHVAVTAPTAKLGVSLSVEDDFADTLADATLWRIAVSAGTVPTFTSVTDDPGKGFIVTLDSTLYTALAAGTKVFLSLADAPTLDDADVTGIENIAPLVVIK